jgi:Shikimate 5-dehydrogenase
VGIIGWPVSHSVSPAIHNAAFAALDLDWTYVPLRSLRGKLARRSPGSARWGSRAPT